MRRLGGRRGGLGGGGGSGARAGLFALGLAPALIAGCRSGDDPARGQPFAPFTDRFDRADLGPSWKDTGGGYRVREGELVAQDAHNHPLWLRTPLPEDATVEVDVRSRSDDGDIKLELFGDGESFDPDRGGYVSSGYVLIFGGWRNSLSVICRNNEHDDGRKASRVAPKVQPDRTYHMRITRRRGRLDWWLDGAPFLAWTDPQPLVALDIGTLAFDDWESEVHFDNLSIRPAD